MNVSTKSLERSESLLPEKSVCVSRRKAIGREWYERYGQFVRDHDKVILRGDGVIPKNEINTTNIIEDIESESTEMPF